MADTGLQNIKLQDGYTKLLHTKSGDGVNGYLTQVGSSNGPNIVGTPLYIGAEGDTQYSNPLVKIKAVDNSKPFLVITDSLGTYNAGTDEFPILTFWSDGTFSGTNMHETAPINKGRGVWNGKCMFDFNVGRSSIEFMMATNDSNTTMTNATSSQNFPTIRPSIVAPKEVCFVQPSSSSNYWQMDRLQIRSDDPNTATTASFDASGVVCKLGVTTIDGIEMGTQRTDGNFATADLDINSIDTLSMISSSDIEIIGGADNNLKLYGAQYTRLYSDTHATDNGTAATYIESFKWRDDAGANANIYIGTIDTDSSAFGVPGATPSLMQGSDNVYIGRNNVGAGMYPNTTYIDSERAVFNNGLLELNTAPTDAASGWENYDTMSNGSAILWSQAHSNDVDDHSEWGKQLYYREKSDGGALSDLYTVEKTAVGKAKVVELRDITATSTTPATVTTLPASSAQIYMKGGKLIIAFDDAGVARYYSLDLTDAAHIEQFDYSASEPA